MYSSKQPLLPSWLSFFLSIAFVISGIAVIFFAYLTYQVISARALTSAAIAANKVSDVDLQMGQEGPAPVQIVAPGQPTPTLVPTNEAAASDNRTNIMMMGIDRRPGEAFVSRTDSIMVASIDPDTDSISILSIPRDLYVVIPGHGKDRINTAFVYGAAGGNYAGGAALARQTIEYNLGIPIDHFVLVDFSAVVKTVDTLGGIDVYVPYEINDPTYPDMNYGFDPLYIPSGLQHMDGQLALKYARTRHADNDFGRSARQQQVMLAAKDKALGLGITGLLARAPELFKRVEQGVRTDLSLDQIVALARDASAIPSENIRNEVLDINYVSPFLTDQGAQVLLLNLENTTLLIQELFYAE